MPEAMTIKKLRIALERIRTLKEDAENGDQEAQDLLNRLGQPGTLPDIAAELADFEDHEAEYLAAFPVRVIEGIRAVLHHAANDETIPEVELQFRPGYDFRVSLSEYGDQLTIALRGPFAAPYPRDSYRVGGGKGRA